MQRWGTGGVFDFVILDERPGFLSFRASGKGAKEAFINEGGGYRWQRIPETEKRGRVHTSTITVAVLPEASNVSISLDYKDLDIRTCRGSGAGGQHRNRTESAVQITHRPSGISVRCENERSQHQNKEDAIRLIKAKLLATQQSSTSCQRNNDRRDQVGSGQRGDKEFTIAVQRDQVTCNRTGRQTTYKRYKQGHLEDLHR